MTSTETIYINFAGGIVSPGYLKEVLEIAAECKITMVGFGLRQQLIMDVPAKHFAAFCTACNQKNIAFYKKKEAVPNIVSSYAAAGIFSTDSWLREGVYKDVFDLFDHTPRLKINICDSTQSFVPFFTGHLNWISSGSSHFWYLRIRLPGTHTIYCFPELIYTNDIASVSYYLEQLIMADSTLNGEDLYKRVKASCSFISKMAEKELELPKFSLPYYEGFNKTANSYWLGIYRREELFPVSFLIDLCSICMQTKIGQVYTTPWKSIIIKGIETFDRNLWDYVLGKYRINVRHAANELNWQIEDKSEDGLTLKRNVIRYFDKEDVRTYGLSFAVITRPLSSMFGSVIIRKQELRSTSRLKSSDRFEILFSTDFNPNAFELTSYRQNVKKEHLGTYLVSLCKMFYGNTSKTELHELVPSVLHNTDTVETSTKTIYQCRHCFTVYDEAADGAGNINAAAGAGAGLPEDYHCPLCEAGKEDFLLVDEADLQLNAN